MKKTVILMSLLLFQFPILSIHLAAAPLPLETDDEILEMMAEVDQDNLQSIVETLVGFHTRHTYSDTVSDTVGIGAARRWLIDQYSDNNIAAERFHWTGSWNGDDHPCYNVHASILADDDAPNIILGGHLDSINEDRDDNEGFAPGADDDGSSIAAMLEIGRILSGSLNRKNIIFASFTGEEQGLRGASAFAESLSENDVDITAMLNMDMIGHIIDPEGGVDSSTVRVYSDDPDGSISRQLARYLKWVGESYSDDIDITLVPRLDRPGRGGDHIPFSDEGFASVRYIETNEDPDYQHNEDDLPENMSFSYHAKVTKLVLGTTAVLANSPDKPAAPRVVSGGDGTSLAVYWSGELDQVYVAYRHANDVYWQEVLFADSTQPFIIDSLETFEEYEVSIADASDGKYPSLFSSEVTGIPDSLMLPPENFEATSTARGVELTWKRRWEPNVEGYEIRRAEVRGAQRSIAFVADSTESYTNRAASRGVLYLYRIRTYYGDLRYSDWSQDVEGAIASHHLGTLMIDATPDGESVDRPDDFAVDARYDYLMRGFKVDGYWDRNDSINAFVTISDADLSFYKIIVYHADGLNATYAMDTTAIRKYIANGGKALLSGLRLSNVIAGSRSLNTGFGDGDFLHDIFDIDSTIVSFGGDDGFVGAIGQNGYPDVDFDGRRLDREEQVLSEAIWNDDFREGVEIIATYLPVNSETSEFNRRPVALKEAGEEPSWVFVDFPFFNMTRASARGFMVAAMNDLDAEPASVSKSEFDNIPGSIKLYAAYPNPFNSVTTIRIVVSSPSYSKLSVVDLDGRLVTVIKEGNLDPGMHTVIWNAGNTAAGTYLFKLDSDGEIRSIPMTLLK